METSACDAAAGKHVIGLCIAWLCSAILIIELLVLNILQTLNIKILHMMRTRGKQTHMAFPRALTVASPQELVKRRRNTGNMHMG